MILLKRSGCVSVGNPGGDLWQRTHPVFDASHSVVRAVDESSRAVAQKTEEAAEMLVSKK
jgi:hypothetical protein